MHRVWRPARAHRRDHGPARAGTAWPRDRAARALAYSPGCSSDQEGAPSMRRFSCDRRRRPARARVGRQCVHQQQQRVRRRHGRRGGRGHGGGIVRRVPVRPAQDRSGDDRRAVGHAAHVQRHQHGPGTALVRDRGRRPDLSRRRCSTAAPPRRSRCRRCPPGDYTTLCTVPGHADAGMKGMLMVSDTGRGTRADTGGHDRPPMTAQQMADAHAQGVNDFVAQLTDGPNTEGHRQPAAQARDGRRRQGLQPDRLADPVGDHDRASSSMRWRSTGRCPGR